jgi:broad specificity phosphatase PhoE
MTVESSDRDRAQQILARIAEEYRCAAEAESEFIEWERAHRRDGACDEFARRFYAWLDAAEPFDASQTVIEEQFPEFVSDLKRRLKIAEEQKA